MAIRTHPSSIRSDWYWTGTPIGPVPPYVVGGRTGQRGGAGLSSRPLKAGRVGGRYSTCYSTRSHCSPTIGLTMSEAIEAKRRGNPRMVKGAPSLNPAGRPRVGESLAEAVRNACSPDELAAKMLSLADGAESEQVRYSALAWLAERGHGKVTQSIDASINASAAPRRDLSVLSLDERRAMLEKLRSLPEAECEQ
jgi:hypothetical protein